MNDKIFNTQRFTSSRAFKISFLWVLFALASSGTYLLSHRIESRSYNAAAAFLATGSSAEISLYADRATPTSVDIRPGDQVVFAVRDSSRHDIAEERTDKNRGARLASGEIGQDESYSLVFEKTGVFSFYDRLNQDIRVTVTIK